MGRKDDRQRNSDRGELVRWFGEVKSNQRGDYHAYDFES